MHLFALDPWWNEFYTQWGFYVGVLGLLVGFVGFGFTLWQVSKVQAAAKAAELAAQKTLAESKDAYERFVGAFASRFLSELQTAVHEKDWKLAAVRSHDLAELLATLPDTGVATMDDAVAEGKKSLREFGQQFAEMTTANAAKLQAKLVKDKWKPLLQLLHTRLDQLLAPFRRSEHAPIGSDSPGRDVPGDRTNPARQDEGRAGELGSETEPGPTP